MGSLASSTLHGMMTSGFPNMFIMPAPGQQAVITANITLINTEGAAHIGATVKLLEERGVRIFDVNEDAENEYVEADRQPFCGCEFGHGGLHPVTAQLRGRPRCDESSERRRMAAVEVTSWASSTCWPNGGRKATLPD